MPVDRFIIQGQSSDPQVVHELIFDFLQDSQLLLIVVALLVKSVAIHSSMKVHEDSRISIIYQVVKANRQGLVDRLLSPVALIVSRRVVVIEISGEISIQVHFVFISANAGLLVADESLPVGIALVEDLKEIVVQQSALVH